MRLETIPARAKHLMAHSHSARRNGNVSCSPEVDEARTVVFLGGTVDPPTEAHLSLAQAVLSLVDCVWYATHDHPAYKPKKVDLRYREAMLLELMRTGFKRNESNRVFLSHAYSDSYHRGQDAQDMDFEAHQWLQNRYPKTIFDLAVGADALMYPWAWTKMIELISRRGGQAFVLLRPTVEEKALQARMRQLFDEVSALDEWPFQVLRGRFGNDGVAASIIRQKICESMQDPSTKDTDMIDGLVEFGLPQVLAEYFKNTPKMVTQYKAACPPTTTTTTTTAAIMP